MTYPGDGDYIFPESLILLSATGKAGGTARSARIQGDYAL
jgi:hypothetical protein